MVLHFAALLLIKHYWFYFNYGCMSSKIEYKSFKKTTKSTIVSLNVLNLVLWLTVLECSQYCGKCKKEINVKHLELHVVIMSGWGSNLSSGTSAYQKNSFVRSFVRSLRVGVQPTLDPSAENFWISPMRQPRQRVGVNRCVCGVRAM